MAYGPIGGLPVSVIVEGIKFVMVSASTVIIRMGSSYDLPSS